MMRIVVTILAVLIVAIAVYVVWSLTQSAALGDDPASDPSVDPGRTCAPGASDGLDPDSGVICVTEEAVPSS